MAADRYTRCPHCASVFRVWSGQLQQAQGWLRCAQCHQAFDTTGRVVLWGSPDEAAPTVPESGRLDLESLLRVEDKGAGAGPAPLAEPASPAPSDELLAFEQALASFPVPAPAALPSWPPESVDAWLPEDAAAEPVPAPRRRAPVWAVLLVLLLLGQAVWTTRALWAVHWPVWGQWAQTACDRLGCAWFPWHEPRVLALEHAHLSRSETAYRLQWGLHNQASWPAAMPALELTLIDGHEQVALRRVLSPAELQAPPVLGPQAHWSGELNWQLPADLPVAGYRLLVFYP